MIGLFVAIAAMSNQTVPTESSFPYDGFIPPGAENIHDPAVTQFKGYYLCFCTGNGIGFLRTSQDLLHWKVEGPVIPETPDWLAKAVAHHSVWAPEAVKFGKGLRLYYCASARFGKNDSWIAVAECPNFDPTKPTQGWQDLGPIISSRETDNFNAIDPDVMTDKDGRQWMFFGSYWSGIYVTEIDPATGKLKDGTKTLVATNPADKANGLEAPCGVYHDGYYYLFVNYGLAAQGIKSTYQIVVGRSKTPNGPFLDSRGKPMNEGGHELFLNSSSPMFGPGGGVEFQDENGRWLMSCHYYDSRRYWHDHVWGVPTLQIRELVWTEDGWPVPGLPITPETVKFKDHPQANPIGKWTQQADFGWVQTLEINRNGTCTLGENQKGTWTLKGDRLGFKWPKEAAGEFWVDDVRLVSDGHYFVGRNQNGMVVRGVRK